MKKRVFHIAILIVLMNVLSPVLAVGEEGIFQNNSVLTQLGLDSYTWTEDWIIVAHGYKYREDSDVLGINCYPEDHYSLTLYDRNEKVSRILAADIPAVDLVIKLDNDALYLYWDETSEGKTTCYLEKWDIARGTNESSQHILVDDAVLDQLLHQGTLYLFGSHHIYAWDLAAMVCNAICETGKNENRDWSNHAFVQNEILFFQNGQWICGYDITAKTISQLAKIDYLEMHRGLREYYDNRELKYTLCQRYHYIVLSNGLYYYDLDERATVMIDLDTMQKNIISEDEYYFVQAGPDGIIAQKRVASDVPNSINYEYVYAPYVDKDRPTFEPDSVDVYPIWDRVEVPVILIGSDQYMIAGNEGIAASSEGKYYEKLSITVRDLPVK